MHTHFSNILFFYCPPLPHTLFSSPFNSLHTKSAGEISCLIWSLLKHDNTATRLVCSAEVVWGRIYIKTTKKIIQEMNHSHCWGFYFFMLHKIIYKSIKRDRCDTKTSVFFYLLPASQQPSSLHTVKNMRQYDVCELNISTIVEISDQSFMPSHLNNRKTNLDNTSAGAGKGNEKRKKAQSRKRKSEGLDFLWCLRRHWWAQLIFHRG